MINCLIRNNKPSLKKFSFLFLNTYWACMKWLINVSPFNCVSGRAARTSSMDVCPYGFWYLVQRLFSALWRRRNNFECGGCRPNSYHPSSCRCLNSLLGLQKRSGSDLGTLRYFALRPITPEHCRRMCAVISSSSSIHALTAKLQVAEISLPVNFSIHINELFPDIISIDCINSQKEITPGTKKKNWGY